MPNIEFLAFKKKIIQEKSLTYQQIISLVIRHITVCSIIFDIVHQGRLGQFCGCFLQNLLF